MWLAGDVMDTAGITLSVVVPVYNEAPNLEALTGKVMAALAKLDLGFWELIFVDDGSRDETPDLLAELAARHAPVRAIKFAENQGQTAAMDAGFRAARGSLVVTLDGDLQNDPEDIAALLDHLGEDVGCVCGVRTIRQDSFLRKISSRIANGVRNRLSNENITDTGCSLKLFRRECLDRMKLYEGMHRFLPTLVKMEGYRVVEVPVKHHPRFAGDSKYGVWNRVFKSFFDLLAVRWMKKRLLRYRIEEVIGGEQ